MSVLEKCEFRLNVEKRDNVENMKTMIFAAGLGTRLKPITDTLPKALVPLGGKPLLEHVSRKLMASGINEAVVNVHHFADKIEDWIAGQDWIVTDTSEMAEGKLLMQVSDERRQLLETGGAVLHARSLLEGCEAFLVHNVDIMSDLDIPWFISQHGPHSFATLLVSERKSSRYLLFDPETMRLVGWTNVNTGEMRLAGPWVEPERCRRLAFSGIHILSEEVLGAMEMYALSRGLYTATDSPRFSIIDFYLEMCSERMIYGVEAQDLNIVDVGKIDTLEQAEEMLNI